MWVTGTKVELCFYFITEADINVVSILLILSKSCNIFQQQLEINSDNKKEMLDIKYSYENFEHKNQQQSATKTHQLQSVTKM